MKKIILSLVLVLAVLSSSHKASAQWVVIDPTNLVQNTIDVVENTISAIANPTTALQQTLDTVNKTVLIPMRDALTIVQIMQNSKMITALITASTGGDSLLVTNPELYLKNKGLAVTQGGIDTLAKQNNIFGNSIIGSVVASAKFNSSSLTFKLDSINKSSIPSITQNKICNDDAALSAMARSDTTLTGTDYNARKTELYNSLCSCDPNANTDAGKQCARKLTSVNNKNPTLDSFYAITQGDNAYTKAELTKLAIADDAAAKKEIQKADLSSGGGIKSQTTCTKKASNGGCIEQTINQAGSVLNDAYQKALGSGLQTAISSIGSGAGSLIGTIFTTISLVQGINTSLGSVTGSGGGSNTGGSRPTTYNGTTTATGSTQSNGTQTSTAGFTQDLVNNPQTRAVLSAAPMDQLNYHRQALLDLGAVDNNYISAINSYNTQLDTLKSCFDNLVRDFPDDTASGSQYGTQVSNALNFVSNTKAANTTTLNSINSELGKIDTAGTLVASTISTIQTSNSTDEITSTFQNYQNQIRSQGLPDMTARIARESDLVRFNGAVQVSNIQGGQYYNYNASCSSIRQEINSRNANLGAGA